MSILITLIKFLKKVQKTDIDKNVIKNIYLIILDIINICYMKRKYIIIINIIKNKLMELVNILEKITTNNICDYGLSFYIYTKNDENILIFIKDIKKADFGKIKI